MPDLVIGDELCSLYTNIKTTQVVNRCFQHHVHWHFDQIISETDKLDRLLRVNE
jgi:hypothetical protein